MRASTKMAILALATLLSLAWWKGLNALLDRGAILPAQAATGERNMPQKIKKTDKQWKAELTPEQYRILRKSDTERPFTGAYNDFWETGVYLCAGCGTPLFPSETKYEHGTGWPSFTAPVDEAHIEYKDDYSLLMKRVEVRCAVCGGHLGHVFDDGPAPTFIHFCINSAAMRFVPGEAAKKEAAATDAGAETATFAAGCFWGVEHKLGLIPGVLSTVVGYTGGATVKPTYEEVCTGRTGHAEAVRVTFDPSRVSYEELVRRFFELHDPTQLNRQGPDRGTQYRSAIFTHSEEQAETARRVMRELETSGKYKKPLATEVTEVSAFYEAEEYHQKYFRKKGFVCG